MPESQIHLSPYNWRLVKVNSVTEAFLLPTVLGSTSLAQLYSVREVMGHVPSSEFVVITTNSIFISLISLRGLIVDEL